MTEKQDSTTPAPRLTDADLKMVSRRVEGVLYSCRALWQMSKDYSGKEDDLYAMEAFRVAVGEMLRSNIRGLDACLEKLMWGPTCGNFESEFSDEA